SDHRGPSIAKLDVPAAVPVSSQSMTAGRAETLVIVGANLTGGAAATTLRDHGFEGSIVMIGAEPHPPYERPALSKDYLRGETAVTRTLLHRPAWYGDHDVDLRLGTRAMGVEPN